MGLGAVGGVESCGRGRELWAGLRAVGKVESYGWG